MERKSYKRIDRKKNLFEVTLGGSGGGINCEKHWIKRTSCLARFSLFISGDLLSFSRLRATNKLAACLWIID